MKLVLEIKDDKFPFFMELIKNLPFVKADPINEAKAKNKAHLIEDIKASVNEVNLAKQGKIKLRTLKEVLDEL